MVWSSRKERDNEYDTTFGALFTFTYRRKFYKKDGNTNRYTTTIMFCFIERMNLSDCVLLEVFEVSSFSLLLACACHGQRLVFHFHCHHLSRHLRSYKTLSR